jgi:hypothetical protein
MYEVEFRKEIGTTIPLLMTLLNDDRGYVQSDTASALTKLADHGELVVICYPGITYVSMKSSFARRLRQSFLH